MKKIMLMACASLLVASGAFAKGNCRDKNVSEKAIASFSDRYPDLHVKKWQVINGQDVAAFKANNEKNYAYFTNDGRWLKTETELTFTKNLPAGVRAAWNNSAYASWNVATVKKVKTRGQEVYTVKVYHPYGPELTSTDNTKEYRLYFTPNGNLENTVAVR